MIKVENVDVWGFEHAIRGMRNPMNSWDKSDSGVCGDFSVEYKDGQIGCDHKCLKWSPDNYCGYSERLQKFPYDYYMIGKNDLDLMKRLYKAGTEHRTYARMIQVSMDITAPLYWWKEMDRYTVGKSQVSCSTMHKIAAKEFELDDFSWEQLLNTGCDLIEYTWQNGLFKKMVQPLQLLTDFIIPSLNVCREKYIETKDKKYWWQLIQLLPSSYNQKRTVCMSYETVFKMIHERKHHRLMEWREFVEILLGLPCVKEIMDV